MRVGWTSLLCGAAGLVLGVALARAPSPQEECGAPADPASAALRAPASPGDAAIDAPRARHPALAARPAPQGDAPHGRVTAAGVGLPAPPLPAPPRATAAAGERRQTRSERAVSRRLDAMVEAEARHAQQGGDVASAEPPADPALQRAHATSFAAGMLEGLASALEGDDPQAGTSDPRDSEPGGAR